VSLSVFTRIYSLLTALQHFSARLSLSPRRRFSSPLLVAVMSPNPRVVPPQRPLAPALPPLLLLAIAALAPAACTRNEANAAATPPPALASPPLTAHLGDFERRILLTGEIDAASAVELKVPRVPNGKVALRTLAAEGAEVKAGDVVAELDTAALVVVVKDRTLQLSQAEIDLERQISQNGVLEADKELDLERKRAAAKRAEVDADVPPGILPKRDFLEKQMALHRAQVEVEKATDALAAQKKTDETEVKLKRIAVEKLRRVVSAAEDAIATLTLHTSEAGTIILADHPEERRKLQEGDDVFMGMTVARVTGSSARRVRAWLVDVDDGKVTPGMPARVTLDAYPERVFSGQVRELSPVARAPGETRGAQRRVFTVNVELSEADAATLRPGLSARVEVIAERATGVLLVPRATVAFAEPPRVRLASGGEVPVELGGCDAAACVIKQGVAAGTALRRVGP
jgi:HlyD family secretion protein